MSEPSSLNWLEYNQRHLSAELERIRSRLEQRVNGESPAAQRENDSFPERRDIPMSAAPPALSSLCAKFNLSPFERDVLLLCAGIELDSRFPALCASAQGDHSKPFPTFSLSLAILPDSHWSALSPAGPLRYWRLVEVGAGDSVTQSPLRIDESILHYLAGTFHLDERLASYVKPLTADGKLVPSHEEVAKQISGIWSRATGQDQLPIIQLCGDEGGAKPNVAAFACDTLGMDLHVMSAHVIPSNPLEAELLSRLWERAAVTGGSALYLDLDEVDTQGERDATVGRWIALANYPLIVSSGERRSIGLRRVVSFDVNKPTAREQYELWRTALGPAAERLNGRVESLISHFNLDARTINAIAAESLMDRESTPDELGRCLWKACSSHAYPRLGALAQRIEPMARWEDLVLPEAHLQTLHDIGRQIRQRLKVHETWGFAGKSTRGLGISALFAGVSGTGKTMAAEVIANELHLDLYRIDLSQVVSKYIGETEKNLRRVFDSAEESSAILLFDEADALFGKRSEVKDSHDRYANVEISYLLQRMEAYRGLAILTTNMKEALDQAFLRRIRFVVQFPFPDAAQRAEIWRRVFPSLTPTKALDVHRLAKLSITGGNIRNIALYAAFLAADSNEPVCMDHLLHAVRVEFAKLEKPLIESEIGGWA